MGKGHGDLPPRTPLSRNGQNAGKAQPGGVCVWTNLCLGTAHTGHANPHAQWVHQQTSPDPNCPHPVRGLELAWDAWLDGEKKRSILPEHHHPQTFFPSAGRWPKRSVIGFHVHCPSSGRTRFGRKPFASHAKPLTMPITARPACSFGQLIRQTRQECVQTGKQRDSKCRALLAALLRSDTGRPMVPAKRAEKNCSLLDNPITKLVSFLRVANLRLKARTQASLQTFARLQAMYPEIESVANHILLQMRGGLRALELHLQRQQCSGINQADRSPFATERFPFLREFWRRQALADLS